MKKINNKIINRIILLVVAIVVLLFILNPFKEPAKESKDTVASSLIDKETDTTSVLSYSKIAVLPFLNSKLDQNSDYLGFAIANQIIEDLSYLKNIAVRPSSTIRKYENQSVGYNIAGEELNVDYILTGDYSLENNIIRVNVELMEINSNTNKWRETIELDFNNIFELQKIIAKKIASSIDLQFNKVEFSKKNRDIPSNALAYEYYLKGLALPSTLEGNKSAKELLEKSIELDSNYAPAYAQLADRTYRVSFFGIPDSAMYKAVENKYLKALALNDELISAKTGLAGYYLENARMDEALKISNQILDVYPNNVDALLSLGYVYRYAGMDKESIMIMEKALANDPHNSMFRSLSLSYYYLGDIDSAIKVLEKFEEEDWVLRIKGYYFYKQGKHEQAIEIFDQFIAKEPTAHFGMVSTIDKAIIEKDKITGLETLQKVENLNILDPEFNYFRACDYALLGDKNGCLRLLQRVVDGGFFNYPLMLRDPSLDSLRNDPSFKAILLKAKHKHESFKEKYLSTIN